MINEALADHIELALQTLAGRRPHSLTDTVRFQADLSGIMLPEEWLSDFCSHLSAAGPNDRLLNSFSRALHVWDHEQSPHWAKETDPHTEARRAQILRLLGFSTTEQATINSRLPRFTDDDLPIIIADRHEQWYQNQPAAPNAIYWKHYAAQLPRTGSGWNGDAVAKLDASVTEVISRLSDPCRGEIYPSRGLVVGYVQSGKTSHFNGLVAKAIDTGYRLVIILAGTLELLRKQTQRRIDRDLVGTEILGLEEYSRDNDWRLFVSHGDRPSQFGQPDIDRLTTSEEDYTALRQHLAALQFRRADPSKPLNHPDNLRSIPVRLLVLKKNATRINNFCKDLERLSDIRQSLGNIPALVIDDESDQASLNTIRQDKPGSKGKRSKINGAITRLLRLLPRAQYVGYTATPFANVFVDPEDGEDLFPRDFIVSLPRPSEYMGARDFYDFDQEFERGDYQGNKNAFVRDVVGENESDANMPMAIDCFVVAGAIKLFREAVAPQEFSFKHHTMLVHHASQRIVHSSDKGVVENIFRGGARYSTKEGFDKLRQVFESDFAPVSAVRGAALPFPKSFDDLRPFVSACISKIKAGNAVRIVNGDDQHRDDTPDFDQSSVWAILVGGAKLSRGYTVEGLTVSYYRRPTGAGDTLMQMGRWFGFRHGYRDLVRLFIGSQEQRRGQIVNLYDHFGAICRDEEALRVDLKKYKDSGLTPRQVPPLVRQHLPSLPPTAKNKMFNAEIASMDFASQWSEKTISPSKKHDIDNNRSLLRELLDVCSLHAPEEVVLTCTGETDRKLKAIMGSAAATDVVSFLNRFNWDSGRKPIALEIAYLQRMIQDGSISRFQLLIPLAETGRECKIGSSSLNAIPVIERARVNPGRFGVFSEPRHRELARYLVGQSQYSPSVPTVHSADPRAPVLVIYLAAETGASPESVGFGIQYPGIRRQQDIEWTVKDPSRQFDVIVDVPTSKLEARGPRKATRRQSKR